MGRYVLDYAKRYLNIVEDTYSRGDSAQDFWIGSVSLYRYHAKFMLHRPYAPNLRICIGQIVSLDSQEPLESTVDEYECHIQFYTMQGRLQL